MKSDQQNRRLAKLCASSLALGAAVIMLSSCQTLPDQSAALCENPGNGLRADLLIKRFKSAQSGVMVVAHRTCWREAAENSLSGIRACVGMGVDMIEIDVRRSKDGVLVLMHDDTIDRTTDGSGLVSELSLAELRQFRLRVEAGGPDSELSLEGIPTLEQALSEARGKLLVNIDAKDDVRRDALELAKRLGMIDQIVIKTSAQSPTELYSKNPDYLGQGQFMPIVRELDQPLSTIIDGYAPLAPEAFEVIYSNDAFVGEGALAARQADSRIWINTIFESLAPGHSDERAILAPEAHWGKLIRDGANMFQTDRPRELLDYLRTTGHHCQKPGGNR